MWKGLSVNVLHLHVIMCLIVSLGGQDVWKYIHTLARKNTSDFAQWVSSSEGCLDWACRIIPRPVASFFRDVVGRPLWYFLLLCVLKYF